MWSTLRETVLSFYLVENMEKYNIWKVDLCLVLNL